MSAVRTAVLAAICCLPTLAGARQALAGCALPRPVRFAPPSKARLPPEPTIYLFLLQHPSYGSGKAREIEIVDEQDASLDYDRQPLPGTRDVQVVRLHVKAKRGKVVLRVRTGEGVNQVDSTATYRIDTKWRLPAKSGVTRIVDATYTYSDGCPASNGFVLTMKPFAPAYRVTGDGTEWVVPGRDGQDEKALPWARFTRGRLAASTPPCRRTSHLGLK